MDNNITNSITNSTTNSTTNNNYKRSTKNTTKKNATNKNATNKNVSNKNTAKRTAEKNIVKELASDIIQGFETTGTENKISVGKSKHSGLKISFLGGVGEVGKNIMAVEYGNDILIIDSGSAFPNEEMPGVDLVVPDVTYLTMNKDKIKAILITHGHEDHIGAIPFVAKELPNVPIYGSRLSIALMENKLKEHKVKAKFVTVKARTIVKIGVFSVEFVKVTHSISGAFALSITSPAGTHFHTGDFKIDYTPTDGEGLDFVRLAEISKKGVLVMTSDSTNAERKGFSISEARVGVAIDGILAQHKTKRVFIATFASNVHRVQQLLNLAEKYGRKVAFSGRSMINTIETASKIGEITFNKSNMIDIGNINKYKDEEILVITTGTQGEPSSALVRMASGDFNKIEIGNNDLIILSSSAIPGNEKTINAVMNNLYKRGASIIYESLAEVHTSGHAFQEELKTMLALVKPKYFIPVHGEFRQLNAHKNIAITMGIEERNILIPELGDQIGVSKNVMKRVAVIPNGVRLVDGIGISDVSNSIIRERMQLAEEGLCVVVIAISKTTGALASKPDIISRGFIYNKENEAVVEEARNIIINTIISSNFKEQDWALIKNNIRKSLSNYFLRAIKRRPLILPIIIETK